MVQDIELSKKDDYFRIPFLRIKPGRKIKFKGISFKNISERWNNFRLERLKKKLEAKKENLVEMEFSGEQLTPSTKRDRTERKILRKTQAIARLESKINFLENGQYHSEEFKDSRAIKLKSLMMKNLVYNKDSIYCVTEKAAEEIMSDNGSSNVVDAEAEKIGARVREILAEKAAARKATENSMPVVTTKSVPVDSSISSIDESVDNTPIVTNDEIAAAIDTEMKKIIISGNESSPVKVNKFINEDGTYRLKREDIDEDFRITRFDRSKLPISETDPINTSEEPEIPPFSTTAIKRKTPDVDVPRKAITAIVERKNHEFPQVILPTIREPLMETAPVAEDKETERDVPVVVPERKTILVKPKIKDRTSVEVVDKPQNYGDLGALIARVNLLKAEKQTIENMSEEAKQKANSVDSAHKEMMRRLSAYADSLEADCNASYQAMSQVEKDAATKEAQINAMIEIMAAVPHTTQEGSKGRAK